MPKSCCEPTCDWCGLSFVPRLVPDLERRTVTLKCLIERAHVTLSFPDGRQIKRDWQLHEECAVMVREKSQDDARK